MVRTSTLYLSCILAFTILPQVACLATDYYVDSGGGNDGNSGLSAAAAWKTIGKVNASSFAAGDRVLLKRGQVWREQLVIPSSGISGQPVIFGAYGTGDRPLLKGSDLVQNWTAAGTANVWRAPLSIQPNQVFFDGVRGTLESSVQNLDRALEWFWSSGTLYVYAASDPGGLYRNPGIEASVRPSTRAYGLIHFKDREYVTVEGIAVSQSYSFGVYIKPVGRYITVSDCEVSHSLDGGIVVPQSGGTAASQVTLLNCIVHHNNGGFKEGDPGVATYHEGVTMEYIDGFTIRGCRIYENYMEGLNAKRGAKNGVIENCVLYANGLINIYQDGASNIEIRYNRIYDCTYNAGIEFGLETSTYGNDNIAVHHNLFWGNSGGMSFWSASGITSVTSNIRIQNNTFFGNEFAVHWKSGATNHYSGTNSITNNAFWQSGSSWWGIKDDTTGDQGISRTSIGYNVFQQGASTDTTGSNSRIVTDPGFVNASADDFHLRSGSPCIDAGTNLGMARDYDGTAIPQGSAPDIGAYEYASASSTTTYTLTVSGSGGTVTRTPDKSSYTQGESVTLQVTPDAGRNFAGWSGDLIGTTNPATLVMNSNKSVTATFTANAYTLTINAVNGSVSKTPDKTSYAYGDVVTLQAVPNAGYNFSGWSGDASGTSSTVTVTMNANKSVTARFTANTYTLTVAATNGSVTKNPDKASYSYGETVTLRAVPDTGYSFSGWSGDASGTSSTITITMNTNKSVTATFTSVATDRTAPALSGCRPAPDSIQAPTDTLVALHITDGGTGVDAASVSIEVGGQVIYSGDVDSSRTAYGICRRYGTKADYTYVYQQAAIFRYSTEVPVTVTARDLAGNAMLGQTYCFATEMYSFGLNHRVAEDQTKLDQGRPVVASDTHGDIWVAWQGGATGARQIYVSRLSPDTATYGGTTQLSQSAGDHCNPAMATDGAGNLYLVWQENARGTWDVCFSASANGGAWSTPKAITDPNGNQTNPAVAASRGPSGLVAVAWQDDRAHNQDIYVATSTNHFLTATTARVTSNSSDQTDPAIAIDCADAVCVLWTDARNSSADIYGAASSSGPWTNVPIANGAANQSQPTIAAGSTAPTLYMAWTDDAAGNLDVRYASSQGLPTSPLTGTDIIDDTCGADQRAPVIAVAPGASGTDNVLVCWEDARNVASSGDTDLYFADLSAGAISTNVLVDDGGTNSDQREPALGIDPHGYPYIAWTNGAGTAHQIYYCGATHADPVPIAQGEIAAAAGGTIGTPPAKITTIGDVSVVIPAQACPFDATVRIAPIRNPHGFATDALRIYDFGPSGLVFTQPATITIPYNTRNAGKVKALWYDSVMGTFSNQGITDVQDISVGGGLHAMQFKTTHFTPFYLTSADGPEGDSSAGGGCALVRAGHGDVPGYCVPYLLIAAAMLIYRRKDMKRRMVTLDGSPTNRK
jgi:uncharacterized repeat protein (TIGR02543 family)